MMRIMLGHGFFVDVDNLNWTLKKSFTVPEKKARNGEIIPEHEADRVLGYYNGFEKCINGMLKYHKNEISDGMVLDLQNYLEFVNASNEDAIKRFKEIYKGVMNA